ncbi:MAG: hypothetical protein AB1791_02010 [Chloroflexota bacterium]
MVMVWFILGLYILALFSGTLSRLLTEQLGLGGARYMDEAILLLLLLVVGLLVLRRGRLPTSPIYAFLLLFSLLGWLTSLLQRVPADVALLGFLLATKPLVIYLAYHSLPLDEATAARLLAGLDKLFITLTIAAVAYSLLFEQLLHVNLLPGVAPGQIRFGLTPARSFFVHPSPFTSMMTLAAFYHFGRLLQMKRPHSLLLLALAAGGVILGTRIKALFLLPVGILVIYALASMRQGHLKVKNALLGTLLVVVCLVFVGLFANLLQDVLLTRLSEESANVRSQLLRYALVINAESSGLGAGWGTYGSAISALYHYSSYYYRFGLSELYGGSLTNPSFLTDQWWSWYLGETGYLGTAVFLFTLLLIMAQLAHIAAYWRDRRPALAALAYTAVAALVYGVVAGYAGAYLTSAPIGYYIMSLAGLVCALHRALARDRINRMKPTPVNPVFSSHA